MDDDHGRDISPGEHFDMGPPPRDGESSQNTSTPTTRTGSPHRKPRERKRVGFTQDESRDVSNSRGRIQAPTANSRSSSVSPFTNRRAPEHARQNSESEPSASADRHSHRLSHNDISREVHEAFGEPYNPQPRPAIRKGGTIATPPPAEHEDPDDSANSGNKEKERSGMQAQERALKLAKSVETYSAPISRRNSNEPGPSRPSDIPLIDVGTKHLDDEESDGGNESPETVQKLHRELRRAAHKLVTSHTRGKHFSTHNDHTSGLRSGYVTPKSERQDIPDYVPPPKTYRGGVLSSLLKLYGGQTVDSMGAGLRGTHSYLPAGSQSGPTTPAITPPHSPEESGSSTPKQSVYRTWHNKASQSTSSLAQLIGSSSVLATAGQRNIGEDVSERVKKIKADLGRKSPRGSALSSAFNRMSKPHLEDEIRITVHIAETMARQKYLLKLCRALMIFGAPTHRLEEYMKMSARVLEIEGQFLYIPGCMIISFDDVRTHTTEVKIVRTSQGVDLGRLRDTHEIYKDVVHDRIGVEEATQRLTEVMDRKPKYAPWLLVPVYGLASALVGPFAFQARLIDLPVSFLLGSILGILQLVVAPSSDLYANVFEVSATVVTSLLARMFGSLRGGDIFCFSALTQSSIALILPGYTVLCGSLELQSRSIVAGSVRMVYAIIYSLFLGYGITIGTALYGLMDSKATSSTQCKDPLPEEWNFVFVAGFALCLIVINQAKWRQSPAMMFIALAGYAVNFFSSKKLKGNAQVSNTLGALAIGLLANLYSRLGRFVDNFFLDMWESHGLPHWRRLQRRRRSQKGPADVEPDPEEPKREPRMRKVGHGLAAAAMLPAIFVQVPSGIAVSGSLVSGITSANQITGNGTGSTTVSSAVDDPNSVNSVAFTVGFSVIQVAIGITVGLFLSAILIYPLGKRRSGLFSF